MRRVSIFLAGAFNTVDFGTCILLFRYTYVGVTALRITLNSLWVTVNRAK